MSQLEEPELKRCLGLPMVTFYGLGTILGAGIYALIGEVAGRAGIWAPLSFLLASVLATFTALSYSELAGRFPRSAGEAVYVDRAFSRPALSLTVGLLVVLTGIVSAAAIANSFAGYLRVFVECPPWIAITALVLLIGLLAGWGIGESMKVAMIITLVEIGGLVLVMWAARGAVVDLPTAFRDAPSLLQTGTWGGIWLGGFLAFYAFIGFEDMVNVVEEVKDPPRTMRRAIAIALGAATMLYVLATLIAVLAVPSAELAASDAPLALVYETSTGSRPTVITVVALLAVTNGALVQIIMGSRIIYGLSRERRLPGRLGRVHPVTRTPLLATAIVTALVLALALWFPLVQLAEATTFIILVVFGLVNLSLLVLRRRPAPEDVRTWPAWVPLVGLLTCAGFVALRAAALLW